MNIPAAIFVALVAFSVFTGNANKEAETEAAKEKPSWYTSWFKDEPAYTASHDVLSLAASEYGVPAWYLQTTWKVESNLLEGEQGISKNWPRAADLAKPGSVCEMNRGHEWCQKQWRALKSICKQNGGQVCDPETVRTSWAFAMGPMQILPSNIYSELEGGKWTNNAADFDGDGTVNPLELPDAMAMAAKISRRFHDTSGHADNLEGWLQTSEKYLGGNSQKRREKILDHAEEWCEDHDCGLHAEEIASR